MQTRAPSFATLPTKLIAAGIVAVCLLLGFAGLLLPLLPGLLFLALAAVVAAKLSPPFAATLRRHAALRRYLERTDGIAELPLGEQAKLVGLLVVKALIDATAWLVAAVTKLVRAAERA